MKIEIWANKSMIRAQNKIAGPIFAETRKNWKE